MTAPRTSTSFFSTPPLHKNTLEVCTAFLRFPGTLKNFLIPSSSISITLKLQTEASSSLLYLTLLALIYIVQVMCSTRLVVFSVHDIQEQHHKYSASQSSLACKCERQLSTPHPVQSLKSPMKPFSWLMKAPSSCQEG